MKWKGEGRGRLLRHGVVRILWEMDGGWRMLGGSFYYRCFSTKIF